jgi:beta-lactamase regulating signal transducer with metallopeptidase domain
MQPLLEIALNNAATATMLAILAAGLCRLYRRPAFAHGLWLIVLLKLVTPPLVPVPLPIFSAQEQADTEGPGGYRMVFEAAEAPRTPSPTPPVGEGRKTAPAAEGDKFAMPVGVASPHPAVEAPPAPSLWASWRELVVLVWLAGSVWVLVRMGRSVLLFGRLLRFARKAGPSYQSMANELAGKVRLARCPEVWLVPGPLSPMLWALGGRARLLFPADLLERLDGDQLRTILLHELAHWRRRDHWARLLEMVVLVLYWWHPAFWWARAELREAEEQCCDAWVVQALQGAGRTYALALLETVAFLSKARLPLPVAASGIGQVPHLRRRLTMILSGRQHGSLTWTGCAGVMLFGLLGLFLVPARAEGPEKKADKDVFFIDLDQDGLMDLVVAGEEPDKEAVELLKRALQLLAEKKKAATKSAPKAADVAEAKKAHAEVEQLAAEVEKRRAELAVAEARLAKAKAHLAALGYKDAPKVELKGQALRWHIEPQLKGNEIKMAPVEIKADFIPKEKVEFKKGPIELKFDIKKAPIELKGDLIPKGKVEKSPDGKVILFLNDHKAPTKKPNPEDLKARLDRLLKEVEELRREVERSNPSSPPEKK